MIWVVWSLGQKYSYSRRVFARAKLKTEGLYSQKIKTLKNFKIKKKRKINLSWKRKFPQLKTV